MSFFGKIVSNLFSREVPPETVQEVNVTAYTNFPVSNIKPTFFQLYIFYLAYF